MKTGSPRRGENTAGAVDRVQYKKSILSQPVLPPGSQSLASIRELEIRAKHLKCRSLSQGELDYFRSRRVEALTLATPWPVLADRVHFDGAGFFDFAGDGDNGNAAPAFVIGVLGDGGLIDLCAWQLETDRTALWLGRGFALGETQLAFRHHEPLPVWRTPLAWLRANRVGIVILNVSAAWSRLADLPILAEDIQHGNSLEKLLTPPRPLPTIFVRRTT